MREPTDPVDALLAAWRVELPDVIGPSTELIKRIMLLGVELAEVTRRVLPEFGLSTAQYDVLATLRDIRAARGSNAKIQSRLLPPRTAAVAYRVK